MVTATQHARVNAPHAARWARPALHDIWRSFPLTGAKTTGRPRTMFGRPYARGRTGRKPATVATHLPAQPAPR